MKKVVIQEYTTKEPITMIGKEAGICWGGNTSDAQRNFNRGIECLNSEHGRTFEYPDVYMIIDGYSARTIREWYTHIGGSPTRLQASTRYIDYKNFGYVTPPSIADAAYVVYTKAMDDISKAMQNLSEMSVPKEDVAMLLPLGMTTKIADKRNLRNLIEMSHQRLCNRTYWEYRQLFSEICVALKGYSDEWKYIVDNFFKPKCQYMGECKERNSCGYMKGKRRKNNDNSYG